ADMRSGRVLPSLDAAPLPRRRPDPATVVGAGARARRRRPRRPIRRCRGRRRDGAAAGRARGIHRGRAGAAHRRAVAPGRPDQAGAHPPPDEPEPRTPRGPAAGPCAAGYNDGIVLFDPLASRWLMSELAAVGEHLCVYVSRTSDPLAGGWVSYDFPTPAFPDYPKYAVWPDGYYVTTNESAP